MNGIFGIQLEVIEKLHIVTNIIHSEQVVKYLLRSMAVA